jgi:hypothetical protein
VRGGAGRRSVAVVLGLLAGVGALAMVQQPALWAVPLFIVAVVGASAGSLWDDQEISTLQVGTMLRGVGLAAGSLVALVGGWLVLGSLGVLLVVSLACAWRLLRPSPDQRLREQQVESMPSQLRGPLSVAGATAREGVACRERELRAEMARLDPDELWTLWSAAHRARTSTGHGVEDVLRLVTVRTAALDELERRDPDGFSLWLSTLAPADLAPYLERS